MAGGALEKFAGRSRRGDYRHCRAGRRLEAEAGRARAFRRREPRRQIAPRAQRRYGNIGRRRVRERSVIQALALLEELAQ